MGNSKTFRLLKLFWVGAILLLIIPKLSHPAFASGDNSVIFSYGYNYVEQSVDITSFAGSMATVSATVSAMQIQGGPDKVAVKLLFRNGEDQQVHSLNDP
ncbi:MAG: hypothetical protein O3A30_04020, partial [Bacteroidetes bacterium]|nr:hypothetical protein [Bacteroidota bacterium]